MSIVTPSKPDAALGAPGPSPARSPERVRARSPKLPYALIALAVGALLVALTELGMRERTAGAR